MNLTFKRLHPDAVLPTYAHEGDSGMDLRAVEDVVLLPGVPTLVRTGLAVELPPTGAFNLYRKGCDGPYFFNAIMDVLFEAQIRPRSGLALKHGITVVNAPGTVDSGFRGEIGVILRWDGHAPNAWEYTNDEIDPWPQFRWFGVGERIDPPWFGPRSSGYRIRKGDRIAQMVIAPVVRCVPAWGEVGETERSSGGFGSTGK